MSNRLSNFPIVCQRDSRWSRKKLGFGTGTIGSYGCLLCSFTAILQYFKIKTDPIEVNEKMKEIYGYVGDTKNLWVWNKPPEIYPVYYKGSNSYNDTKVKNWLADKVPVIIQVDGAPIGAQSHFVVSIGGGKIMDPWFGDIRDFSFYTPQSYYVYTYTGESMGQSPELAACLQAHKNLMQEIKDVKQENAELRSKTFELEKEFSEYKHRIEEENKFLNNLLIRLKTALDVSTEAQVEAEVNRLVSNETIWQKCSDELRDLKFMSEKEKLEFERLLGLKDGEIEVLQAKIDNVTLADVTTKRLLKELLARLFKFKQEVQEIIKQKDR